MVWWLLGGSEQGWAAGGDFISAAGHRPKKHALQLLSLNHHPRAAKDTKEAPKSIQGILRGCIDNYCSSQRVPCPPPAWPPYRRTYSPPYLDDMRSLASPVLPNLVTRYTPQRCVSFQDRCLSFSPAQERRNALKVFHLCPPTPWFRHSTSSALGVVLPRRTQLAQ